MYVSQNGGYGRDWLGRWGDGVAAGEVSIGATGAGRREVWSAWGTGRVVSTGSAPTDLRSNLKQRRRARPGEHEARRSSAGSHGRREAMSTGGRVLCRARLRAGAECDGDGTASRAGEAGAVTVTGTVQQRTRVGGTEGGRGGRAGALGGCAMQRWRSGNGMRRG